MANFQPDTVIQYDGQLLKDNVLLYDTTQGVRIWGDAAQDNYSIGDTTTGGVDVNYGLNNLAFGQYALNATQGASSSKNYNVAIGTYALSQLSSTASLGTSADNIAIGRFAGRYLKRGNRNVLIGTEVLSTYSSTILINDNVAIGSSLLKNSTTIGSTNIIVGSNNLNSATTFGNNNVFMGSQIGGSTITEVGDGVVAIGSYVGYSGAGANYIGEGSIYLGTFAGVGATSVGIGGANVCIGFGAGGYSPLDTSNVVVIGNENNGCGNNGIMIGAFSGNFSALGATSGVDTIVIGSNSAGGLTSGQGNIVIGSNAANNLSTGSNNIIIGTFGSGGVGGLSAQSPSGSNNIDILTNSGSTGIQYTNSTSTLKLKSNLVNIPEGRFLIDGTTSDDNIPMQVSPTISTTTTANIYTYYHNPSISPTTGNLNGNAIGIYVNPKYISNFIPNAGSSHYSGMQIITGATSALTTAIPDVRGLTISFTPGLYAATVAPVEYTHIRLTDPILNGSTATYNIYSGSNTATGKWNLYLVGTSSNHILSTVLLGSTTDSGTGEKLQVTGSALVSSNLKVYGSQINTLAQANTAWLGTGTANSTTFLRGDGTWDTPGATTTTTSMARTFALMGA